jgi:16S rRNA (cytosine967-C5)-methyltransferase
LSAAASQAPAGLSLRLAAGERLRQVLGGAHFAPFSADELDDPRDRALANRLVTAALRRQGHLDIVMRRLLERGLPPRSGSFEAQFRLALTQLLYLPEAGAHSAIFLGVEALKHDRKAAHLTKLMNAALRRAQAEAENFRGLPIESLIPDTARRIWLKAYGKPAIERFAEALLAGAPLDLTLKAPDPPLIEALGAATILPDIVRLENRDRPVEQLPGYEEGSWWVQDVAASLPARLIDLPRSARVLDLCAAPGGKTAQLVKAGYSVTALDNDEDRLDRLRDNLARLGYRADAALADAAEYTPDEPFDAVLLDAPCSATGTFRRHPEVIWHRDGVAGRVELQRRLFENALRCLKPGGVLVYCVCSLEPEEGEAQADWAAGLAGVEALPIAPAELGPFGDVVTPAGYLRTTPAMAVPGAAGTLDGFFAARFRRK